MEFEFRKVTEKTYYFNDTNRVLLYKIDENTVVLFDSGKNAKAGKKILDIIRENGWTLKAIYLSHSHADHMGGAAFLRSETACKVYAPEFERHLSIPTIIEPGFMYGGFPPKEMCLPFLCAEPCPTKLLTESVLPQGIEMFALPGHTFNMYGFKTDDDIYFLADAYVGSEILSKHPVSFLYDVKTYLETLDMLELKSGNYFIAAHANPSNSIHNVLSRNRENVLEVIDAIVSILKKEDCNYDQLLAKVFTHFNLVMNFIQHYLVGCIIKSYLIYLRNEGLVSTKVIDNQLLWYGL
jgi:glyoxylase-like metal-dependent hydrolase (beta-lactamase superfamily II)